MRRITLVKTIFTLVCIIFLQISVFSQGGYYLTKGKIIDKFTKLPLSNAYISIPSIGYGTAPNLDGDFLFQFPRLSKDSLVVVSSVGYKSLKLKGFNLRLEDNLFELEPIPLFDANYGLSDVRIMLKAAVDSIKTNYNTTPYYQLGFYHEQVDLPGLGPIKLNEGVLRVERFPDLKEKIEKVKLLSGRRIEWKGQTNKINGWGFQNGTQLVCRSLETEIPDFLEKKQMKKYDFRLDSLMTQYEDLPLFIIHFWPLQKGKKGGKEGTIYLEPETKAIVKIQYKMVVARRRRGLGAAGAGAEPDPRGPGARRGSGQGQREHRALRPPAHAQRLDRVPELAGLDRQHRQPPAGLDPYQQRAQQHRHRSHPERAAVLRRLYPVQGAPGGVRPRRRGRQL